MSPILQLIALILFFHVIQELLRRAYRWIVWAGFFILPLALTPFWLSANRFDPFQWFKLYTVCFCVSWGTLLRFTSLGTHCWARRTIPLLLAANILEATILDLFGRGLAHSLNAAAGLLLIATTPYGSKRTTIDAASPNRDLLLRTSFGWILGYTLWNWTFVYLNYPALVGHHTAVLAAAFVVALVDPRRWTQTRAFTLGINLILYATFCPEMCAWFDTSHWFEDQFAIASAGVTFVVVAGLSLRLLAAAFIVKLQLVQWRMATANARVSSPRLTPLLAARQ